MTIYAPQRKGLDVTVGLKRTNTVSDANEIPNLAQVESIAQGLAVIKQAVTIDIHTNIDLANNGLTAIGSYTPTAGDRVLVIGQTTTTENGIYVAGSGAWVLATDADTQSELKPLSRVSILTGDHAGRVYQLLNSTNPVPGTDVQDWQVTSSSSDSAADVVVVDTSFTQLTGTDAQTVLDDVDNKLQDIHDERKQFTSTTLTSGTGITFNHALNGQFLSSVEVYESSSPYARITSDVTIEMTDANNIEITNDAADVDVIVVCKK
ncbi:hypothetical protein NVP1091O_21 [Vibrio phage 1.091.O._10N.286.52.B12]|nr:hypothetical protein NVP1091O_21 [Vibrio phage 1.091.O._10N.286.52.B12]